MPPPAEPWLRGWRVGFAVAVLLTLHVALATRSLILENPTVDEVIHLPAGITYWQTGSFRMYHHNPPLVKLVAALPVLFSGAKLNYRSSSWLIEPPNKAEIAHEFMKANAADYFELFTRARLLIPLFSVVGGLVVFAWSRRLYGIWGGLLSLSLWVFCPNVLAHARLITSDLGATALGALATYWFWRDLKEPSWGRASLAGVALGLSQLSKFSMLILYGLWPLLALGRLATAPELRKSLGMVAGHALGIVALSVLVIDVGYLFEGVGIPLGNYDFACQTLTRPLPPGAPHPSSPDQLLNGAYQYRVNRFRGTFLDRLPVPLPRHYVLGFDDQKLEAEGIPRKYLFGANDPYGDRIDGYPVYLNGVLRQKSWWDYYLLTLVYKVPEGTWMLVLGSFAVLIFARRGRDNWFDELALLAVPVFVLAVMSVLTNINLGLRYVLPIFPFLYIAAGKLAPWAATFSTDRGRVGALGIITLAMVLTVTATAWNHPHYLAYFNVASGGPDRGAEHLIDSNLDWGQDLVGLRRWLASHAPGERVGLAYFGQVNPSIFEARDEGFPWFLPPPEPGSVSKEEGPLRYRHNAGRIRLEPGLYAVSASLVEGLPWRVYDDDRWAPYPTWFNAFGYFRDLKPFAKVGYSIFIYRVTPADSERLAHYWERPDLTPASRRNP
jgi:Dolichyl-phosphate-mannose-protein mannosyltransferase